MANDELDLYDQSLPIIKARAFADTVNLQQELDEIEYRCREPLPKRGLIVQLFEEQDVLLEFLDTCWPYGKKAGGANCCGNKGRRWLNLKFPNTPPGKKRSMRRRFMPRVGIQTVVVYSL